MTVKYFTVAEANRTLPLVRRIVLDIVTDYQHWRDALGRYELSAAADRAEHGESRETRVLRQQVDDLASRINNYIGELGQVGCVLKGFDEGQVDFHSTLDGRDVFLCWKLGEERVAHYHELDAGYSGRQVLEPATSEGGKQ